MKRFACGVIVTNNDDGMLRAIVQANPSGRMKWKITMGGGQTSWGRTLHDVLIFLQAHFPEARRRIIWEKVIPKAA